jgi:hypothetical protein
MILPFMVSCQAHQVEESISKVAASMKLILQFRMLEYGGNYG